MQLRIGRTPVGTDLKAGALAGSIAGLAYLAVVEIEGRVLPGRYDDRVLLGGQLTRDPDAARAVGTLLHLGASTALGAAYALAAHGRLPGPVWLRGVLFANAENTLLYPLTAIDGLFAAIADGRLDPYWTLRAYLRSIPRHIVYGALLGALTERLSPSPERVDAAGEAFARVIRAPAARSPSPS